MFAKLSIPILFAFSGFMLWLSWSWLPLVYVMQGIAFALLLRDLWFEGKRFFSSAHKILFSVFVLMMVLCAVPVFLPETGFDALWYHLPITEVFAHTHRTLLMPELYQSAMPRLGSFMFVPSYVLGGVFGVKLFVYLFSLFGISWVFVIARKWFTPKTATFLVACIYAFHVFGWQSSSAYVDQIRFVFEIAAIWIFLTHTRARILYGVGAVLFGFALSTKLVALFFFPALLLWLCLEYGWVFALRVCSIALLVVLPWYAQAYQWTGNPLYPLFQSLDGKELFALAGVQSLWKWIVVQILKLPFLPFILATNAESYTSPLFVLAYASFLKKNRMYSHIQLYVLVSGLILLFILPFSFRYAWSAMVILFLLFMKQYCEVFAKNVQARMMMFFVGSCGIAFHIAIRLGVVYSALPLLQHHISEQQYLQQYETSLSSGPFSLWYEGYWHKYTYPTKQ